MRRMHSVKQAAAKVGISEGLLVLWISTGKFKPSVEASDTSAGLTGVAKLAWESYAGGPDEHALGWNRFALTDTDVDRLRVMVEATAERAIKTGSTHVAGTHYTVRELSVLWGLSVDTVRALFEDEPGVIKLKNPAKKGKRTYTSLRIPETVADKVSRRLAQ
jgi:hypothetical protein